MNLESFIRIFFEDKKTFEQLDIETKSKYLFMFNRYMSRLYPKNVELLNRKYFNDSKDLVMDCWSIFCEKNIKIPNNFKPNWKSIKKIKNETILSEFSNIDKKILLLYKDLINDVKNDIEYNKKCGEVKTKRLKI